MASNFLEIIIYAFLTPQAIKKTITNNSKQATNEKKTRPERHRITTTTTHAKIIQYQSIDKTTKQNKTKRQRTKTTAEAIKTDKQVTTT